MFKASVIEKKHKKFYMRKTVDIGFLQGIDPDVILRAAENEYGTNKVPERSFMRSTFDLNKRKITKFARAMAPSVIADKMSQTVFMEKLGRFVKELIENRISTAKSWAQPLANITIRKKGHDRPLIETYAMITSIKIRVK